MKIAIVGATPTGTVVAAFLKDHFSDVTLINVHLSPLEAIQIRGIAVSGTSSLYTPNIKVKSIEQYDANYDIIFIFSPVEYNDTILPIIKSKTKKECIIVSFQEALSDNPLIKALHPIPIISGVCHFQAHFKELHKVNITTDSDELAMHAFDLSDPKDPQGFDILNIKSILDYIGQTIIVDKKASIKWSKAVFNASVDSLSNALNCSYGDIIQHPLALQIAVQLADEVVRTAKKLQIDLTNTNDINYNDFLIDSDSKIDVLANKLFKLVSKHSASKSAGASSKEPFENINSSIIRVAKKVDQPTPFNDIVLKCLQTISITGEEAAFHENIQLFEPLIKGSHFL